jgi:hypothetical protein
MARGSKCACGCGQQSAATMRQRKLTCDACGCGLRMSRQWIERVGAPSCACGGAFLPDCLEDRCRLPGDAGAAARSEYMAVCTFGTTDAAAALRKEGKGRGRIAKVQCHGCKRFLKHPRELCKGCGFQNDPRPGCGGYVETTYAGGFGRADDSMPF